MKKDTKQRLFEVMGRLDPSFKRLNEITVGSLNLSDNDVNEIMKGYIESALWTEEENLKQMVQGDDEEYGEYLDDDEDETEEQVKFLGVLRNKLGYGEIESFTEEHISPDSRIQAYLDIKKFLTNSSEEAINDTIKNNGLFRLGMDIWLTRNGHGSGFFDHSYDYDNTEKILTQNAKNLGSVDLYVGDDNKLYFSNEHR
jgi:hypothetical protein